MTNSNNTEYPFQRIIPKLILSIYKSLYDVGFPEKIEDTIDNHNKISDNFKWVKKEFSQYEYLWRSKGGLKSLDFESQSEKIGNSAHNSNTLFEIENVRKNPIFKTRISSLIMQEILRVQAQEKRAILPYPLKIILDFLTIPEYTPSKYIALYGIKYFLFSQFNVIPDSMELILDVETRKKFSFIKTKDIEDLMHKIDQFTILGSRKSPRNLNNPTNNNVEKFLVHYFATTNNLEMRFKKTHTPDENNTNDSDVRKFLNNKENVFFPNENVVDWYLPEDIEKIQNLNNFENEIMGLQLPFRGLNSILRGGLHFSFNNSLSMAIHGGPGTGKTSIAIALAGVLAILGIRTYFITVEESEEDLKNKLLKLIPYEFKFNKIFEDKHIENVSFKSFSKDIMNGLFDGTDLNDNINIISEFIHSEIKNKLSEMKDGQITSADTIPMICNKIFIFDGIHDYYNKNQTDNRNEILHKFEEMIRLSKTPNTLLLLTMADTETALKRLDYLVDFVMELKVENFDKPDFFVNKIINFRKARFQAAEYGAFHYSISPNNGFYLVNHFNKYINKQTIMQQKLSDTSEVSLGFAFQSRHEIEKKSQKLDIYNKNSLSVKLANSDIGESNINSGKFDFEKRNLTYNKPHNLIRIYKNSSFIIHGVGSGGKAGFALHLALSPFVKTEEFDNLQQKNLTSINIENKNVLIVSFLYPQDYYDAICDRITSYQKECFPKVQNINHYVEVKNFYAGLLDPHAFLTKILERIERAKLYGRPFDSIIIDGLHNVFVQFPYIENSPLVWSTLIRVLKTYNMSIIFTHTTLEIEQTNKNLKSIDVDTHKSEPLRNAIIDKTDYQIEMDRMTTKSIYENKDWEIHNTIINSMNSSNISEIRFLSSVGIQKDLDKTYYWSRQGSHLINLDIS